jgi:hypothetical protein
MHIKAGDLLARYAQVLDAQTGLPIKHVVEADDAEGWYRAMLFDQRTGRPRLYQGEFMHKRFYRDIHINVNAPEVLRKALRLTEGGAA